MSVVDFEHDGLTYRARVAIGEDGEGEILRSLSKWREYHGGEGVWVDVPVLTIDGPLYDALWRAYDDARKSDAK